MAERKRSAEDASGRAGGKSRSRSLGRTIATSLVVAGLVYLIGSGCYSVIPQVFWPRHAEADASIGCADGLTDLRAELLARSRDHVGAGGAPADLQPWLRGWDNRHLALEDRCTGEGAVSWDLLGRLRQRLESTLVRFDRAEGDLDRDLTRSLARASTTASL